MIRAIVHFCDGECDSSNTFEDMAAALKFADERALNLERNERVTVEGYTIRGKKKPPNELLPVRIGSGAHLLLIRQGYLTHHTDGQISWMEPPLTSR